jgi:hypothetical protein
MGNRKRTNLFLTMGSIVLALGLLGWFLSVIFEGEKPLIALRPLPEFISKDLVFDLTVSDKKSGLKKLDVSINQEGREITVFEKVFPFEGLFNNKGIREFDTEFSIDPQKLNLAQGRADLRVRVWDCSRRKGGDGNLSLFQHKMVVDTIQPAIRAISGMSNINLGGSGLVVYQTSSDTVKSGIFVDEFYFAGFPARGESQKEFYVCYFAVPYTVSAHPDVYLWAEDRAGNSSRASFYYHIRKKRFRTEKINITDHFLKRILTNFSNFSFDPAASDIEKFLKINSELRKENESVFYNLRSETSPDRLWSGTWVRLKNAATMARFLDRRLYYYQGKKIDEQVHLGIDLASLENSEVQAANRGRVIFADRLGIYGLTVVLDHGQGISSIYSHLSRMDVKPGQEVMKEDVIGLTGQTGLAGGDHLHFGVLVAGVFVNPLEWWDSHWIRDNITSKLAMLE